MGLFQESRFLFRFNPHLPLEIPTQAISRKAQYKIITNQQSGKCRGNEYRFWADGRPGLVIG